MIYAFIRGFIGGFGRMLMDFYIAHSLEINTIILFYGLCVYMAHISYLKSYRQILVMLGINVDQTEKGKTNTHHAKLDFSRVNWDEARRAFWFPLISSPTSFYVRLKTRTALHKYFNEENIEKLFKAD